MRSCPLCQVGALQEHRDADGHVLISCSEYPVCRFESTSWEGVDQTAARFRHPVSPGQI